MAEASGERAVAAGGDVRNVATGDHVQQIAQATVLPAQAFAPVGELGKRLVKLPLPTRLFVGREREIGLLDGAPGVVCVHGLGGIGKSTLVAKWARDEAAELNPVWWITADTPAAIDAGLTGLGIAMQPELADVLSPQALRERALQWLAAHEGWLIVLDDVSEPADVEPLLERAPGGRFVITSRRATGWHEKATCVDLGVFDTEYAAELFRRICPEDGALVPLLVRELGNLPLAVEQAAAFCRETGTSAAGYLELLDEYREDMFAATVEGGDLARTVARVWRVTLDRLAQGDPAPVDLLRVLAWFAPDRIPRSLVEPAIADPPAYVRAVGRLAAHSMISVQGETLSVHRLVQAVVRLPGEHAPAEPDAMTAARDHAVRLLLRALPDDHDDPRARPDWYALMPHVQALADHVGPDGYTEEFGKIMNAAGLFLLAQGNPQAAGHFLEGALATCLRLWGRESREALTALASLAEAYASAGSLYVAEILFTLACETGARILGEESPQLAAVRGSLASVHHRTGDRDTAVDLYARSLDVLLRTVGGRDPRTLRVRGSHLNDLIEAGEGPKTVPLVRTFVEDCARVHGEHHPATLTARAVLARAYEQSGDLERAIELWRRTAADRERVLGGLHPRTLASLNGLAGAYHRAGRASDAVLIYEQALEGCKRTFGEFHEETLRVWEDRAAALAAVDTPE